MNILLVATVLCELCGGSGIETLGTSPDNDLLQVAGLGGVGTGGRMSGGSGTETLGSADNNDDHIRSGGSQGGHCSNYCGTGFAPGPGTGVGGIRGGDESDHLTGHESKR